MARTALTWRVLEEVLVGTYHEPSSAQAELASSAPKVGVLLLNGGPAPRAGNSDLSVHIADRLASRGIPVFRFDLPGLGDSPGVTPATIDAYWRQVLLGRNDAVTIALAREVKRRFGLETVVAGGLCAAAVPILRSSERRSDAFGGVILLEPQFRLLDNSVAISPNNGAVAKAAGNDSPRLGLAIRAQKWKRLLTRQQHIARAILPLRRAMLRARRRSGAPGLPKDANLPLILNWQESLSRGTPSIVVVAEEQDADRTVTAILDSFKVKNSRLLTLARLAQTNHIFTAGDGRGAVAYAVERWMIGHFGACSRAARSTPTTPSST